MAKERVPASRILSVCPRQQAEIRQWRIRRLVLEDLWGSQQSLRSQAEWNVVTIGHLTTNPKASNPQILLSSPPSRCRVGLRTTLPPRTVCAPPIHLLTLLPLPISLPYTQGVIWNTEGVRWAPPRRNYFTTFSPFGGSPRGSADIGQACSHGTHSLAYPTTPPSPNPYQAAEAQARGVGGACSGRGRQRVRRAICRSMIQAVPRLCVGWCAL